ncbi:hypothetical protein IJJ39_00075 [Candidatus Saccharibacteria bacterium]|nr:hypothetical protein [Candidatus Saccharibacteria bacterium]
MEKEKIDSANKKTGKESPKMERDIKLEKDHSKKEVSRDIGDKKSNVHKNLIKWIAVGGGVVLLIVLVVITVLSMQKESDITSAKIMRRLEKRIPMVTDVVNYSEANDPNGIMGQENQYTSKSSWEDKRLTEMASEHAGTIEVFKNVKDAELREWKIDTIIDACKRMITAEKYGKAVTGGWNCEDYYVYRMDAVVVRLSVSLNKDQLEEYVADLSEIIQSFVVPNEDVPTTERINELRKQTEENLEETLSQQEENLKKSLDELLLSYSQRLDGIMESLNEDEFKLAKEDLATFKDGTYFAPKIAELEQKINTIQSKIDEKKRLADEAAAQAEADRLASKNRRLGSGKYEACVDVESGTYDVTAVGGSGNLFVHSDSYLRNVNELMSVSGAYGWDTEYKNMTLQCGDMLEIKNGLTVQLIAKR